MASDLGEAGPLLGEAGPLLGEAGPLLGEEPHPGPPEVPEQADQRGVEDGVRRHGAEQTGGPPLGGGPGRQRREGQLATTAWRGQRNTEGWKKEEEKKKKKKRAA